MSDINMEYDYTQLEAFPSAQRTLVVQVHFDGSRGLYCLAATSQDFWTGSVFWIEVRPHVPLTELLADALPRIAQWMTDSLDQLPPF